MVKEVITESDLKAMSLKFVKERFGYCNLMEASDSQIDLKSHRISFEAGIVILLLSSGYVKEGKKYILKNGKEIALTRLEFDLLVALAKEPGRVFTREALLSEVWGYQHAADTRLVNVHVQRLRSKIEIDADNPKYVLTVRGVGYKAGVGKN